MESILENGLKILIKILFEKIVLLQVFVLPISVSSLALDFKELTVNQGAAEQPSQEGRKIKVLSVHEGKIYSGYGDYNLNTGPIDINSISIENLDSTTEKSFTTESVERFNLIDDILFVPNIDPYEIEPGGADVPATIVFKAPGEPWQESKPFDATHIYDIIKVGSTLYAVGSWQYDAMVWSSEDGGFHWKAFYSQTPPFNKLTSIFKIHLEAFRYYFIFAVDNKIYTQASALSGLVGSHSFSSVFDGEKWTKGPDLLVINGVVKKAENFLSKAIYLEVGRNKTSLNSFDGSHLNQISIPNEEYIIDFYIENGELYGLGDQGSILKTPDLENWQNMGKAPDNATSIAVSNQRIIIGTSASTLYIAELE